MVKLKEGNPGDDVKMTERNVLNIVPIKEKLKNLRDIFPGQEDDFYQFVNYLADMLNDQLIPSGFYVRMSLTISDCRKGIDGYGRTIRGNFIRHPDTIYFTWKEVIINSVANLILPKEFATELKEFHNKIIDKMQENREKKKDNIFESEEEIIINNEKGNGKSKMTQKEEDEFGKNMEREISLLDYSGTTNKNVKYHINEDGSGIYLRGFDLGSLQMKVDDIVSYKQWQWGKITKGSGQVGVYYLSDQKGKEYFALIKDYRAMEGDWRIALVNMRDNEAEFKQWLEANETYGKDFSDYWGNDRVNITF